MIQIKCEPKERFNMLVKECLSPFMKERGFKKRGPGYYKEGNPLTWVIDLQKSRYNDKDRLLFVVNWGLFVPNLYLPPVKDRITLRAISCAFDGRFSDLYGGGDCWAEMKSDDEDPEQIDQEFCAYIKEMIDSHVIPFFESITSVRQIAELLEHTPYKEKCWGGPLRGWHTSYRIALLYRAIGEKEKGIAVLEKMQAETKNAEARQNMQESKERYIAAPAPDIILE